jgi:hypothetical protein
VVLEPGHYAILTLTLRDYGFEFSKPLTPAKHVIRVRNAASQPHEVEFFRVAPGKSIRDFLPWERKRAGPPPAMPLGGVNGLERGAENNVALELTPGEYGMICFFPDSKDGQPHFAHGMITQFTVSGTSQAPLANAAVARAVGVGAERSVRDAGCGMRERLMGGETHRRG